MADDAKKPYGDVKYADPGYQEDKKKRYPLDSEAHCRAAWSYINMPKNASAYSSEHLKEIKGRIKAALKKYGAEVSADSSNRSQDVPMDAMDDPRVETRSAGTVDVDYPERIITVVAVPYEQPTQVAYKRQVWNEVFSRSAFNGLDPQKRRIPVTACLKIPDMNHSGGELIGRIQEVYTDRDEGLVADVKVSRTPIGQSTLELAHDGALSASVGFMVKQPHYDETLDVRSMTRRINRAFLEHLAFVAQPAYDGAKVLAVRSTSSPEDETPGSATPVMDEWLQDPLIQQAMSRSRGV
jgi:HK97 family phage prohead protease